MNIFIELSSKKQKIILFQKYQKYFKCIYHLSVNYSEFKNYCKNNYKSENDKNSNSNIISFE